MPTLLGAHHLVLAETYPADAYDQIWPDRPTSRWSKRRQADRLKWRDHLLSLEGPRNLKFDATVTTLIRRGFGNDDVGEVRLDALVELLGMLRVLRDPDLSKCATSDHVRHTKGWILVPETRRSAESSVR